MLEFMKRLIPWTILLALAACMMQEESTLPPTSSTAAIENPSPTASPHDPNALPSPDLIIDFELILGAAQRDRGIDIIQTQDGGYAILGYTSSFGAGGEDIYLVRIDSEGQELWYRTYGGEADDNGWSILETEEGDFILFGFTRSSGSGGWDFYLLRTDSEGQILWDATYGGEQDEFGWDLSPTADGGYVLAGQTESFGQGDIDGYLIKVDASGELQWSRTYGGPDEDRLYSVDPCEDGGFILTGTSGQSSTSRDVYLVRTDAQGELLWESRIGGEADDVGHDVRQLADGGFAVAGYTMNYGAARYDAMLLRVDDQGEVVWRRLYGGALEDRTISLDITQEGEFILGGYSQSYGNGNWDIYFLQADNDGNLVWLGVVGDLGNETGYTFIQAQDGGIVITGETYSSNLGGGDLIILKLVTP